MSATHSEFDRLIQGCRAFPGVVDTRPHAGVEDTRPHPGVDTALEPA